MIKLIYIVLFTSFSTLIIHISVLFLVPYYAQNNIWTRLEKTGKPYQFVNLHPSSSIHQSRDPLFLLKVCRFNLEHGPVHLTTQKTTQFWSLSAYTHDGIIFYSLNDRTALNAQLNLIIGKPIQIIELRRSIMKTNLNPVLITQDLNEGFVILRVFSPSFLTKKGSETFLSQATCHTFNE
ncbi:DUF1254 domain-containing protein [Bartonella sp. F02]|uniref:DUF1254 domain-containing protein n=1 Tax=Bartonella sp. F02 TaxID=2967262 RepID=UPI0022A9C644|nr:hypothetical protein [Bartonella sp. F02]MCZ2328498.1 hypothetical protein [Bartonella sp. F02]